MTKVILAACVAVFSMTACVQTDAQKDAVKFREVCAKNPQLDECKNAQAPGG
jgi:hypothetical protein